MAPYFARIFYRNAFNTGLLILEIDRSDIDSIDEGDELEICMERSCVINHSKKREYSFKEIPEFMMNLLNAGGLMSYAKERLNG